MKKTKSRRTPRRATPHHIPLGLQMAAKLLDQDADVQWLSRELADADRRAVRLLTNPMVTLADDGADGEVAALADTLGAEKAAQRLAAVIPASATHDPHAWITDAIVPCQTAALYIGLCLGYRIAADLGGKWTAPR